VSFRRHPRAFLLDPSWKLSVEHSRRLRRCVDDGLVSVFGIRHDDDDDDDDEFGDVATNGSFDRSGFDFDDEGVGESFLSMLSSNRTDNVPPAPASFYAIGVERDPNFTVDGSVIVPRSFPYYLAVACGLPIVDAEFISSLGNSRGCGPTNGQCYPFPSQPVADGTIAEEKRGGGDHLVLGASNYTWGAPTRAREAALERHSLWQRGEGPHSGLHTLFPGTDLLREYGVILVGEFDRQNRGKRTAGKRKRRTNSEAKESAYCTRGNVSILLQLCGARVYAPPIASSKNIKKGLTLAEIENTTPLGADQNGPILKDVLRSRIEDRPSSELCHLLVMVKDESDAKSLGKDFISQMSLEDADLAVVSCQWLLDSIGEFEAQKVSRYCNA
jgi:hypothetical protein